jgi:ATP-dependent helicase HrpB
MPAFVPPLPIDQALPRLTTALTTGPSAVLIAPPGAGKTTRVPLVLSQEPWARARKIVVLEPRRLAAAVAAERMAASLGEAVGATVGLRARFSSRISRRTRIEVVTEGVFTRLILDDPSLDGVAAVLFDEFHERSLEADLGLALALDVQRGLREDLRLVVMSATLDGARIASILDAPVIEARGQAFPVETRYLGRSPREPIERQVAEAVERALRAERGSVLVFLPGVAEIERTAALLRERIDGNVDVVALHGRLAAELQRRAIAPAPPDRRKVVLATSVAETSLTIEGIRVVVDSGLARVPRYEPDVGLTRLETVRVSRASAEQRRGRAGRTEPGVCYRLWDEPQTASLEPFAKPEILTTDLSSLILDLAHWGVTDPGTLAFLDPPPATSVAEAKALLRELGAIDEAGRITAEGRRLQRLPLPPRLARMITAAAGEGHAETAAQIAIVLSERSLGGNDVDLRHRLETLRRERSPRAADARRMAHRWAILAARDSATHADDPTSPFIDGKQEGDAGVGALLALAYPDRVAAGRGDGSFLLANGRRARLDPASPLAREPFLVVAEVAGGAAHSRILLAVPITLAEIETRLSARIVACDEIVFDRASATLRARRIRRLGAILLSEQPLSVAAGEETAKRLAEGIVALGLDRLPWTARLRQWRDRVLFLRRIEGHAWPDVSDQALVATVSDWLVPLLATKTTLAEISSEEFAHALEGLLPREAHRRLDLAAPSHFVAPSGSRVPIDYSGEDGPRIAIRVQELYGLDHHPRISGVPLLIELLSPAQRPVQVTRDLPGFWRGSYAQVRAEMRGRYPRHAWPDDPLTAMPSRRAKPRG